MLGTRSAWVQVRRTSNYIRYAVAGVVAECLRRGPYWVMFSGPQWLIAVEEYLDTGYPEEELWSPYINEPPGVPRHMLWKIFALRGREILLYLGDRVDDWRCLRPVARGFLQEVGSGLTWWFRDTQPRWAVYTASGADAADAYLQGDEDLEIDERPLRRQAPEAPRLRLLPLARELENDRSSDEEESEDSTDEPSVSSLEESSEESGVREGSREVMVPLGPTYVAEEERLLCVYGDDTLPVPLEGWSLSEVATIVQGLHTGDWRSSRG